VRVAARKREKGGRGERKGALRGMSPSDEQENRGSGKGNSSRRKKGSGVVSSSGLVLKVKRGDKRKTLQNRNPHPPKKTRGVSTKRLDKYAKEEGLVGPY